MKKGKWIYDIYLEEECLFDGEQNNLQFDTKEYAKMDADKWISSFAKFYKKNKKDFIVIYECF